MPNIYSTGLVSIANNTDIVTGTDTLFITAGALVPGGLITFDDGAVFYRIKAVETDSRILIEALITNGLYVGPTLVDQPYSIYRMFERTLSSAIAAQILDNVEYRVIDRINFSAWAFSADNEFTFVDSLGASQTILTPRGIALNSNIGGGIITNPDGTFTLTSNGESVVMRNGIDGQDSIPIITATATGYTLTFANGQSIPVANGVSPVAGVDYTSGRNGNYVSFIFRTGLTPLATPVGGTFDGTTEVVPAGWDSNYVYASGNTTYISKAVYVDNGNAWVNQGWGIPAPFSTQGVTGGQGDLGPVGPQGPVAPAGLDGARGFTGIAGADGIANYFHLAFADSADGTVNFNQIGGGYIGVYTDDVLLDSSDPLDYTWRLFAGAQGPQGGQGIAGDIGPDGQTSYLHIAYANSADGSLNFNIGFPTNEMYIGTYVDFTIADSTDYLDYNWQLVQGPQGPEGPTGPQGPGGDTGFTGPAGTSSYFHIAYASSADGSLGFNQTSGDFVGTYVDGLLADSGDYLDYAWQDFRGAQGPSGGNGLAGDTGPDGQTSYLHIAYANSADGSLNFNVGFPTNEMYIGTYVDFSITDSTDYLDYNWQLVQGPQGPDGPRGPGGDIGETGPAGTSSYFHIAYASSADGSVGFNQISGDFVGTYVDDLLADSGDYLDYAWQNFRGAQGPGGGNGLPGDPGDNGQTSYLHIAYANDATGSTGFTTGFWTNQTYIGTYVDFNLADSSDASLYAWVLFVGPQGPPGADSPQAVFERDQGSDAWSGTIERTIYTLGSLPAGYTYVIGAQFNGQAEASRIIASEPIDNAVRMTFRIKRNGVLVGSAVYDPSATTFQTINSFAFSYSLTTTNSGVYTLTAEMTVSGTYTSSGIYGSGYLQAERL
jgi:hypothetical protein